MPVVMASRSTMSRSRTAYVSLPGAGPTLVDWTDAFIAEGASKGKRSGRPIMHLDRRDVQVPLPIAALDSPAPEVQLLAGKGWYFLGMGVAKVVEPGALPDELRGLDNANIVGGMGFPTRGTGRGPWRDFSSSRWVIPSLYLNSERGRTSLTLAAEFSPSSRPALLRARFRWLLRALDLPPPRGTMPGLEGAKSTPDRARWTSLSKMALREISKGRMQKVVLSRKVRLAFRGRVPVGEVLTRLVASNPNATVFAFKRNSSVFLGATPESLLSSRGGDVEVECLAATIQRGAEPEGDESLGLRLLSDPKSLREHALVVQAAVSALSPISSRVEVPSAPVLKRLTSIQHLQTTVKASLLPGENVWSAARALWPNPAVGGEPRESAIRWIRRFEGLDRGWYSGIFGVADASGDRARLFVGIRSGVVRKNAATIFAGAGLVRGSRPDAEFEETEWKMRTMAAALGVGSEDLR